VHLSFLFYKIIFSISPLFFIIPDPLGRHSPSTPFLPFRASVFRWYWGFPPPSPTQFKNLIKIQIELHKLFPHLGNNLLLCHINLSKTFLINYFPHTAQHKAITKKARKTNHIERFNNTLRQRVSRLVRSALSFSKKLDNHIGAIQYFICHYNLTRARA
jgi:hypothetical protein